MLGVSVGIFDVHYKPIEFWTIQGSFRCFFFPPRIFYAFLGETKIPRFPQSHAFHDSHTGLQIRPYIFGSKSGSKYYVFFPGFGGLIQGQIYPGIVAYSPMFWVNIWTNSTWWQPPVGGYEAIPSNAVLQCLSAPRCSLLDDVHLGWEMMYYLGKL